MKYFKNKDGGTESEIELKQKYNPDGSELRNVQIEILKMLLWFSDICEKNNLEWFLCGGNILGAVRHQGFIPWDDDMDVYMPEKDCRRLEKILLSKEYKNEDYVLQNHKTDSGYYGFWPLIRHKKSEYIKDDRVHNAKKYRGFQIDIFPLAERRSKFLAKVIKKVEKINTKYFIGKKQFRFFAVMLYHFEKDILIPLFKLFSFLFSWRNKGKLCYAYPNIWYKQELDKKIVYPLKTIKFEGYDFPAPNDIDAYLKYIYGDDYMILPSPSERNNHSVVKYKLYK